MLAKGTTLQLPLVSGGGKPQTFSLHPVQLDGRIRKACYGTALMESGLFRNAPAAIREGGNGAASCVGVAPVSPF